MSLHTLANHIQSAGRGEDKVLVHMTPKEVGGLQSLAMAHGGSLTINPETGLPEAGILSSLLPMVAGFALGPAGFGLMSSMQAGLAVGALTGVATGSLKQGVMAGLGAYGGAGLGEGLMAQGANAAAPVGQNAAQTAITNAGSNAANFAGAGSNPFSSNALFNPAAGTGGVTNVAPTTTGLTSSTISQAPLYPNVNFATGMTPPTPVVPVDRLAGAANTMPQTSLTPQVRISPTDRLAVLEGQGHKFVETNPNAYVTTNVPNQNVTRSVLDVPNSGQRPWDVAAKMPRTSLPPMGPRVEAVTTYPDLSTLKPGGSWAQTGTGRYTITNPSATSAAASGYTPSTATTSQQFAGGMQHTPPASTAVDVSGQGISRPFTDRMSQVGRGFEKSFSSTEGLKGLYNAMPTGSVIASGATVAEGLKPEAIKAKKDKSLIRPYDFEYGATNIAEAPYTGSAERTYFNPVFTARTPYEAPGREYAASGGLMGYAVGGAVEEMAAQNAVGANTGYPMANLQTSMYANPAMQRPEATNVIAPSADAGVGSYSGEPRFARGGPAFMNQTGTGHVGAGNYNENARLPGSAAPIPASLTSNVVLPKYDYNPNTMQFTQTAGGNKVSGGTAAPAMGSIQTQPAVPNTNIPAYQTPEQQLGLGGFYDYMNQQLGGYGGYAGYAAGGGVGGISHLGDYSDGGRLLKGPGDGVSDSIPASIGNRQPARLADGEFVVPARIVSEIGNGSTEAGARKLYAMMDRVQKARRKTVGKNQVARNTKAEKLLPA